MSPCTHTWRDGSDLLKGVKKIHTILTKIETKTTQNTVHSFRLSAKQHYRAYIIISLNMNSYIMLLCTDDVSFTYYSVDKLLVQTNVEK